MEVFALDLGNKQTKMVSSKTLANLPNGSKVFPSVFMYYQDLGQQATMFKSKKKIDKYSTTKDTDFDYAWGEEVNQVKTEKLLDTLNFTNRYEQNEFKLLATFALGELARDFEAAEKGILECNVVTGVPSNDFNEQTIKTLIKVLQGDHQISIKEVSYNVRVKEVYVMNQPIGTIYNEMLDDEGYVQDESYLEDTVTVVDLGGGTFLVDTLKELQLDDKKRLQQDTGAYDLYNQIITSCVEAGIKGLKQNVLEKILRTSKPEDGYYFKPNKNEAINITDHVRRSVKKYTIERNNAIHAAVKDTSSIDKILFTGGGSNLIDKENPQKAFKYIQFVEDPETANVKGYYKYGLAIELENNEVGE